MNLKTELLPYQRAAAEKLLPIRVGALYMEMGTGKTRVALELIARRIAAGKLDRVLWLCPCSVRQSLREELQKHADGALAKIAVYGIESLSSSIRLFEALMKYCDGGSVMLVVDESNLVKNPQAIRTRRVTELATRCRYRIILNGTPISRSEADLFAQWYILDWRILGYRSFWAFAANHLEYDPDYPSKVRRVLNTDYLVEKIAPYSYQISKEEAFTLERKQYGQINVRMTQEQWTHYEEITERMIDQMDEMKPETVYRMFGAAQAIISGLYVEDNGRHYRTRPMFAQPTDNPRICELLDQIERMGGEKIIVFAKYTHEIETILQALRDQYGESSAVGFYGGIGKKERERNLGRFKGNARFLVANKTCAGYGLNLQFCRNIIYYSNDWDWATRAQSEDRVHRLGQTREVRIIDLCAVDTLDAKILRCLARKERLDETVKRELKSANGITDAKGKIKAMLKGELQHGA